MKKVEMVKILCRDYGYLPAFLADKTYDEVRKILSCERMQEREISSDDDPDWWPNGRESDESDEDFI